MLRFFEYILILLILSSAITSFPVQNGTTVDCMLMWENACLVAGGRQRCHQIAGDAVHTLSTTAGPCDQQDIADSMISFAKQLHNDFDMIKYAQIFAQEPPHNPTSQSVPYCQSAPAHAELNGLFQCQFAGTSTAMFVGDITVGEYGTIPFGHANPLSPPGSCPAHPSGPIPAGMQLAFIAQDSGLSNVGSSGSSFRSLLLRAEGSRKGVNGDREIAPSTTVVSKVIVTVAPTAVDIPAASPIPTTSTPNPTTRLFTPELIANIFERTFNIIATIIASLLALLGIVVHARWGRSRPAPGDTIALSAL